MVESIEGSFAGTDGVTLYRRSVVPAARVAARLGIIHGYGDHGGRYLHFMRWLAGHGIASHAVDLRGQGRSSGRRGYVVRWEHYLDDVRDFLALDELRQEPARPPLFLLGHSHGGLVLAAAVIHGIAAATGCVLTAPYLGNRMPMPQHKVWLAHAMNRLVPWLRVRTGMRQEWLSSDREMIAEGDADPLICRFATPRWFLTQRLAQREVLARAGEFRLPLLLLWGGADPIADEPTARQFFDRVGSADKTFKLHPGVLHELLREKAREQVFEDVRRWIVERVPAV